MSKRFGRNQKRRLMDIVSGMERTNKAVVKQLVMCQNELIVKRREIHDIHREICEAFNQYHPLLNKTMEVDRPDMERIEIAQFKAPDLPFDVQSFNVAPVEYTRRIVYLLRLESWPDAYRSGITFRATYDGKVVGYYADNIQMIRDDQAVPYMAEAIASNLTKMLKGDKR